MDKIGTYQILEVLHRGPQPLYRAKAADGRIVALKAAPTADANAESRERFAREGETCRALDHPHVVRVLDVGEADGMMYQAMEMLDGVDLGKVMAEGREFSWDQKLAVMEQLCEGLQYAHEHNLVHRDIKPANLFLENSGRAVVLDFGMVRVAESELTKAGAAVGTVNYMAPEQIHGERCTPASDVFSAGIVFFQFASGRHPFSSKDKSLAQVVSAIVFEPAPKLSALCPDAPEGLDFLLNKALDKDPAKRFRNAGELKQAIAVCRLAMAQGAAARGNREDQDVREVRTSGCGAGRGREDEGVPAAVRGDASAAAQACRSAATPTVRAGAGGPEACARSAIPLLPVLYDGQSAGCGRVQPLRDAACGRRSGHGEINQLGHVHCNRGGRHAGDRSGRGADDEAMSTLRTAVLLFAATAASAQTFVGAGGCASSNCHGAATPLPEPQSRILGNEYATWAVSDRHALAQKKLLEPRGKRMAEILGIKDATRDKRCAGVPRGRVAREVAVGWRGAAKRATGRPCSGSDRTRRRNPTPRASRPAWSTRRTSRCAPRLASACHLGRGEQIVDHELIAAGHPDLAFELDTFTFAHAGAPSGAEAGRPRAGMGGRAEHGAGRGNAAARPACRQGLAGVLRDGVLPVPPRPAARKLAHPARLRVAQTGRGAGESRALRGAARTSRRS